MRGYGRSTLGKSIFNYSLLAKDVLCVLDHLQIARADVIGWSDGGIVGLRLAVDHPERIHRLIAISANYHPDGLVDNVLEDLNRPTPVSYFIISKNIYGLIAFDRTAWNAHCHQVDTMCATHPIKPYRS
jgi:pimeloyl-ACP methyl ester carboxylesterase